MDDLKDYLERALLFTKTDMVNEIACVCSGIVNVQYYIHIIAISGLSWTLKQIASDIFFSRKVIDEVVRSKLRILRTVAESDDLLHLNKNIGQIDDWDFERKELERNIERDKVRKRVSCDQSGS